MAIILLQGSGTDSATPGSARAATKYGYWPKALRYSPETIVASSLLKSLLCILVKLFERPKPLRLKVL